MRFAIGVLVVATTAALIACAVGAHTSEERATFVALVLINVALAIGLLRAT